MFTSARRHGIPDPEQHLPAQARRIRRAGTDPAIHEGSLPERKHRVLEDKSTAEARPEARGPGSGPGPGKAAAHAPLSRPDGPRLPAAAVHKIRRPHTGIYRAEGRSRGD